MPLLFILIGLTISTAGKILLGIAVIRVHGRIAREHSIDDSVLRAIKREKTIGLVSIALIFVGYFFEMLFYISAAPFG